MLQRFAFAAIRSLGRSSWLPLGLRYRLVWALVHPDRAPDHWFTVPFFGRRYTGNLTNLIDWTVFFLGVYEPAVLAFLDAASRGPSQQRLIYLDVGANVGHHVLYMAGHAHVHAFEPYEALAARINQKIADNALDDVTVHTVGLGDRDERRPFYAPTAGNLGVGTFLTDVGDGTQRDAGEHAVVRGDRYLAEHGIAPVGLVKIDVEGFEPYVLGGLRETLARDRPVVQMEWSEVAAREFAGMDRLFADLLPEHYAVFYVLAAGGRGYRLAPVHRMPATGELACIPEERLKDFPVSAPGGKADIVHGCPSLAIAPRWNHSGASRAWWLCDHTGHSGRRSCVSVDGRNASVGPNGLVSDPRIEFRRQRQACGRGRGSGTKTISGDPGGRPRVPKIGDHFG